LVACGAAAGISAVFNAPIAGAFFAAEIVLGRFEMKHLSLLFTASAMGTAVSRTLLGSRATFDIAPQELISVWALAFHVVLGVFCAFLAQAFISLLHQSESYFEKVRLPSYIKPAIGGLAVGIIGLWIPQVFGTGGELLQTIFANPVAPGLLLLWMVGKIIATPLTLGSGGSGGDLMPSLFLGGTLGGAFGHYVHVAFPHATMQSSAYALVGSAAFFAGVSHAPMTAIILGFEMGRDYGVVLPLMVACSVSALVAKRLRSGSLYTGKLIDRGVNIERLRGTQGDPLEFVQVAEVMTLNPISVSESTPLSELSKLFISTGKHGFVVVENDKLVGIVTQSDLEKSFEAGDKDKAVRDIKTPNPVVCYPTDTLEMALSRTGDLDIGCLPVVSVSDSAKVIGIIGRRDIIRGHNIGLSRSNKT
jgi:CIC family chloride channel protein